ncbi:MAG TPA: phosphoserine transaminase [Alphaproteobacteria bacterium]|nr:phosphoserine transaminase [Alphaproteobacteria bacterium]
MTDHRRPASRPARPQFSSGPCVKRPGWSLNALAAACLGRSHRSAAGKEKLAEVIDRSRAVLGMPQDWRLAVVPGSDTGAVEMAMWSLLGPRGVDALVWESFGEGWAVDLRQLAGVEVRVFEAPYGRLPDLAQADFDRDVVFVWNGTTSGVRVPDGGWIAPDRRGLAICDATSAAFAMELPWERLDVVTWSWQKALGGEGGHGMLALGPRALERLAQHRPRWPMPKLFRLAEDGRVGEGIFRGETINTPSMLCVEDALDGLRWAESIGGLRGLIARCEENARLLGRWIEKTTWIAHLAAEPAIRSTTSICLRFGDPGLDKAAAGKLAAAMAKRLEAEGAGFDLGAYRSAPPGLRIWAGPTVEAADLAALLPWLDWAYAECRSMTT